MAQTRIGFVCGGRRVTCRYATGGKNASRRRLPENESPALPRPRHPKAIECSAGETCCGAGFEAGFRRAKRRGARARQHLAANQCRRLPLPRRPSGCGKSNLLSIIAFLYFSERRGQLGRAQKGALAGSSCTRQSLDAAPAG
jgi:hypothetical protein